MHVAIPPPTPKREMTADTVYVDPNPGLHYDQETAMFRRAVPPNSIAQVYREILEAVDDIDLRIRSVELDFYGNTNERTFIKRLAATVKPIQFATDVMAISSRRDMENILMRVRDKLIETKLDEAVAKLEAYNKKMKFYVPKCLKIMQEAYALCRETERYCQSFYDSETMVELNTGKDYEKIRKASYQTVSENMKRVRIMWTRYDNGTGVELTGFSTGVAGIALEAECSRQMFLLLFPEMKESILETCERLREWVKADKTYTTYLQGDRRVLTESIDDLENKVKHLSAKYHNAVSNVQILTEQLDDSIRNFGSEHAEDMIAQMKLEEAASRRRLQELNSLLHSIVQDKVILTRKSREYPEISDTRESRKRGEKLASSAVTTEFEIRKLKNKIKHDQQKFQLACEFQKRKDTLEGRRNDAQNLRESLDNEIKTLSGKMGKMKAQRQLIDAIVKVKCAPSAAYNIYYNLARKPTDQDPIVVACNVISDNIRHKWPQLYRKLPFQGRGTEEVDYDVRDISDVNRVTTADRATNALKKWRRYNTKASINDIRRALNKVNEPKLWEEVKKIAKLDENVFEEDDDEDELKHIPPELRPYYRIIERFDSMRQRHAEEAERQRQRAELLKKYSQKNKPNEQAVKNAKTDKS